jgi:flagella basal body P-ring formation protein FlgA
MILATILLLGQGVTLELAPQARVRGTELGVAQIGRVASDDPELARRVAAASLGYAPAPGYSRLLPAWQVERELERLFPGVDVVTSGAASCRVEPELERVGVAELLAAARAELEKSYSGKDVVLEPAGGLQELQVPAGHRRLELRARMGGRETALDALTVPVEVRVDDELYRTVWTNWRVESFSTVAVLARGVRAGEMLTPDLLRLERVKLSAASAIPPLNEVALDGAIAVRDLAAGAPVTEHDVRRPPLVRRGAVVQLQVKKGAITATVTAIARRDGHLGEEVPVVPLNSDQEVRGLVAGRDLVAVQLAPSRRSPR